MGEGIYRDTSRWGVCIQGDKSWYSEWEKSDASIQADVQYTYSGTETEVIKSWGILIPGYQKGG
jgi:hypothetical protein